MPYKYNLTKQHHFKKHTYRQSNYSDYNKSLKNRGRIDVWISDDILESWQDDVRIYDGTGSTVLSQTQIVLSKLKRHFSSDTIMQLKNKTAPMESYFQTPSSDLA